MTTLDLLYNSDAIGQYYGEINRSIEKQRRIFFSHSGNLLRNMRRGWHLAVRTYNNGNGQNASGFVVQILRKSVSFKLWPEQMYTVFSTCIFRLLKIFGRRTRPQKNHLFLLPVLFLWRWWIDPQTRWVFFIYYYFSPTALEPSKHRSNVCSTFGFLFFSLLCTTSIKEPRGNSPQRM